MANALSARPAARSITVSVGQSVDRRLVVSVVDDGPGVPEDFLTVAFDRFSRADRSRASSGGSGLGLALVQAVARRAGGRATLANEPGGGARATVTVPPRG
jgi:signal transduction histidine kinase